MFHYDDINDTIVNHVVLTDITFKNAMLNRKKIAFEYSFFCA